MIARQRMETRASEVLRALFGRGGRAEFAAELGALGGGGQVRLVPSARAGLCTFLRSVPQSLAIVPAYTCRVVVEAVLRAGKEPVFVDVDLSTFNMIPDQVAASANADSVVLATHQFGIPCDIDAVAAAARARGALLAEDAAGALGTTIRGRPAGSFAPVSFFSFEATKVLSLVRGGFVLFHEPALAEAFDRASVGERPARVAPMVLRALADPAATCPAVYPLVHRLMTRSGPTADTGQLDLSGGPEYDRAFSAWQARLGLRLLARIEGIFARRRAIARRYLDLLGGARGIELPAWPDGCEPVLIRFPVRVTARPKLDFYRGCLRQGLDLAFSFSYSCAPERERSRFPNSFAAAGQVLGLPMYSSLTDAAVERIARIAREEAGR